MLRTALIIACVVLSGSAAAEPLQLAPWKDELFAYPAILSEEDDGATVVVSYDIQRDLYGRDEIPEKRARPEYVELVPQRELTYDASGARLKYIGVGRTDGGASLIVIYIHGQGGSRAQGASQWTFGGNFNRIMNLMRRNGGAYLSPDFTDFGDTGRDEIKALMADQAAKSPGTPIFVSCGSQGGALCWALAQDAEAAAMLGGILLMGSSRDDGFPNSPAAKARVPVYLGHGSNDTVFDWQDQEAFAARVRAAIPGYPIRFTLFDTGSHGTPIRMTDWRLILNWMLAEKG
jgi:hypothetical protein